jgi:hypothetical protein
VCSERFDDTCRNGAMVVEAIVSNGNVACDDDNDDDDDDDDDDNNDVYMNRSVDILCNNRNVFIFE